VYNDYSPERLGRSPDAQLANRFLTDAFIWMFLGCPAERHGRLARPEQRASSKSVAMNLRMPLFIAQLGLGLGIQWGIRRLNAGLALALFFVYAALMGLTIGVWVWYYGTYSNNPMSVVQAFVCASAAFGGAALYGIVTKRSLASIGSILFMGAWGLFFAFLINGLLLHSSTWTSCCPWSAW
jgi:FtsH-binding integral membrane protein